MKSMQDYSSNDLKLASTENLLSFATADSYIYLETPGALETLKDP